MLYFCVVAVPANALSVSLTDNGPAVRGAKVTFTATVITDHTDENLKFVFTDNGVPQHKQEVSIFELILLMTRNNIVPQ